VCGALECLSRNNTECPKEIVKSGTRELQQKPFPGRCLKLGFPGLSIINKSVDFGGESKFPLNNVTSTKIWDIHYVLKLFLA
jgi:hypothetical protein